MLVWDPGAGVEVRRYLGGQAPSGFPVWALGTVRLGSHGKDPLMVSAGDDGVLHVWNLATGNVVLTDESGHPAVTALAGVPGHPSWIASGGSDGTIRIRDLAGGVPQWRKDPEGSAVHALTLTSSGGSIVVTSAHANGTVQFSDIGDLGRITSHRAHLGHARALAADTSGETSVVFSGGDDALIRVWDLKYKAPSQILHRSWVRALAVIKHPLGDPDEGEWALVSGSDDDTIQVRSLDGDQTRRERVIAAHHRGVRALTVAPTRQPTILSGGIDHRLKAWSPSTGKALGAPLVGHGDWIHALASGTLPGVGAVVASASGDGQVAVWDVDQKKPIRPPTHLHSNGVRAVALAELTRQGGVPQLVVVSGSTDETVIISDAVTGEIVYEPFTRHRKGVRALATTYLNEKPVVLSGDAAGMLLAWELESGSLIDGDVPRGSGEVRAIAAQQRGTGCTWVAVAAGDTVTLSSWTEHGGWRERATIRFGCEVLAVAMPDEFWTDEPPGRLAVGAERGVVLLNVAG